MKRDKKYWQLCDVCYQLIFANQLGEGSHKCPELLKAKRDAELDMIMDEELKTWDESLRRFWDKPSVKFEQYMLEREKDGS